MRAVVATNTDLPRPDVLTPWLRRADLVIACDGAARRLLDRNILPDLVVGDMDSLLGSARRAIPAKRLIQVRDPERTDLEKALGVARQRGARDVTIVGSLGDRLDHALANASLLFHPAYDGMSLRLVDDRFVTERVRSRIAFRAPVGTHVSLWTPSRALGVRTRGLRWELHDEILDAGTRGVHNETAAASAEVRVREGPLLIFRGNPAFPHV